MEAEVILNQLILQLACAAKKNGVEFLFIGGIRINETEVYHRAYLDGDSDLALFIADAAKKLDADIPLFTMMVKNKLKSMAKPNPMKIETLFTCNNTELGRLTKAVQTLVPGMKMKVKQASANDVLIEFQFEDIMDLYKLGMVVAICLQNPRQELITALQFA